MDIYTNDNNSYVNKVIPPGMDFSYVTVHDTEGDGDLKSLIGSDRAQNKRNLPPIWSEVTNSSSTYLSLSERFHFTFRE